MSFPAGTIDRPLQTSSESNPPSTSSTESTEKVPSYSHILTHQEKKKQRMPKHKANSWPPSILTDPDVLSLDDEGRFVLCKVCHVHYAVHGGKKPKPVIMNSSFRCRAWEVHKERTNSHRIHKKHVAPDHNRPPAGRQTSDEEHKHSEKRTHTEMAATPPQPSRPNPHPHPHPAKLHREQQHEQTQRFSPAPPIAPLTAMVGKPLPSMGQPKQHTSPRRKAFRPAPNHGAAAHPWGGSPAHELPRRTSTHDRPVHSQDRPAHPPQSVHAINERSTQPSTQSSEQATGMLRWRNMHDDVSRALGSTHSSHKRPIPDSFVGANAGPSMRVQETEDFSGNNERVAKKLKSLDDEYDAKVLKRPEACFDRRSDMYKQYWGTLRDVYNSANNNNNNHNHSQAHANTHQGPTNKVIPPFRRQEEPPQYTKEQGDDFTTPDDSGSSEEMVKPVVVHDQALINALDRLTGVISKQFSDRFAQETTFMLDAVGKLTHAVDDLRMHQGASMNRLVQLQEQKLHVMEELLRLKLEKKHRMVTPHAGRPGSGSA